jgi:archaellum component FlaG (FlaF/FlaG flagellin family)
MPQPNDNINIKIDIDDNETFDTETIEISDNAKIQQKEYPSLYKGYGYKTEKDTEKQLNKIVNDANNPTDTTAQKPSINIQGMIDNDRKKKELLEANNTQSGAGAETQRFIDIAKEYSYRESVLRAYLFNIKDVKIYDDISLSDLKDDNLIINNKETFENIIKFIAKLAHDKKGFDSILDKFFKGFKIQLDQSEHKNELQKTIQKAIRNTNKLIFKINSESTYGALCFEHMKHIFENVIRVGGALFDLKNRRYFDNPKAFDTYFARNGQEFILNVKLLHKKEKKELIPYYQVNTTTSAYKALHEAETPHDIIKRCDAIVNNPFKEYGIYHEGNKTYFNTFITPNIKRTSYESDMNGINLFFQIIDAQYTQDNREALLNWLAQIAQNPFKKLGYALYLQGTQGTGKNVIIEKLPYYFLTGFKKDIDAEHEVFKNYHKVIDAEIFKGTTNPYMRDAFFMTISEVKDFTTSDMNALKEKINGSELTIKQHYQAPDFIPNRINFAFASNYKNGLRIEQNERRYLCIFSEFQSRDDLIANDYVDAETGKSDYWNAVFDWLHNQDGYAKLYDFFLKRDVSQVTKRDAPVTSSKHDAVLASQDQYTNLLSEYDLPEVITACQARALIERKDKVCTSVNRVANALNKLGYEKHPIMNNYGKTIRYGNKRYVIYVKNESIYKNETDKNTLASLAEFFFKAF